MIAIFLVTGVITSNSTHRYQDIFSARNTVEISPVVSETELQRAGTGRHDVHIIC
jgi:ABC-type branched-subunit amino acid transport system substrate-binding protein